MSRELIVFLKPPRQGGVKTRLAASFGPEAALGVYKALAAGVMRQTRPSRPDSYRRTVCFSNDDERARDEVAAWFGKEALEAQVKGDLGARMSTAFANAFARGAKRAVIVGSDCPAIDEGKIEDAFSELDRRDVVLRAAADGGYTLIGLKEPHPELFEEIPWSTPLVLRLTLSRAESRGLRTRVLGTDVDVDTADDLRDAWMLVEPLLPRELALSLKKRLPPEPAPPVVPLSDDERD